MPALMESILRDEKLSPAEYVAPDEDALHGVWCNESRGGRPGCLLPFWFSKPDTVLCSPEGHFPL